VVAAGGRPARGRGMVAGGASWAPVVGCLAVFLFVGGVYNLLFLSRILPAVGKESLTAAFAVSFNVLWLLSLSSYLRTHFSDPGRIPERWRAFAESTGGLAVATSRHAWQPGRATPCKKCGGLERPERAHHCAVCKVCVLRMDHHCPWTANCVGHSNYKYFLLLGVYLCLNSFVAFATALPELVYCVTGWCMNTGTDGTSSPEWVYNIGTIEGMCFAFMGFISLAVFVLLCLMLSAHLPLAIRNLTSIEEFYDNMENPYDHHNCLTNLSQTMGRFGPDWFLPVAPCRPLSDGVFFSRPDEKLPRHLEFESAIASAADSESEDDDEEEGPHSALEELWRFRYAPEAAEVRRATSWGGR